MQELAVGVVAVAFVEAQADLFVALSCGQVLRALARMWLFKSVIADALGGFAFAFAFAFVFLAFAFAFRGLKGSGPGLQ